MSFKDRLIKNLLDIGKKHRILVYPTLALVAIISAISYAINWGKGNGKRLVASIMVMAMLITQSVILTSSADVQDDDYDIASDSDADEDDTTEDVIGDDDYDPDVADESIVVYYYRVDENGNPTSIPSHYETVNVDINSNFVFGLPTDNTLAIWSFGDGNQQSNFTFDGCYSDTSCTSPVPTAAGSASIALASLNGAQSYNVYYKATRTKYPIIISDKEGVTQTITENVTAAAGDINPLMQYTVGGASDYSLYAYGYKFAGFTYGGASYAVGGTIDVQPTEADAMNDYYVNLISDWEAAKFDVTFDAIPAEYSSYINLIGSSKTLDKEYTYGEYATLPDDAFMEGWAGQEGYYLAGWKDENGNEYSEGENVDTTLLAKDKINIADEPNVEGIKLEAIWAYKDVQLKTVHSSNCTVTTDSIVATYGDNISTDICAEYAKDNSTGDSFTYDISTADKNTLGYYGLNFSTNSNGSKQTSFSISGQPSKTTDTPIKITIVVTDNNKSDADKISTFDIAFTINKRQIHLDESTIVSDSNYDKAPFKLYDGKTSIGVRPKANVVASELANGLKFSDGLDDVYVVFDSLAQLDKADAGTAKNITLSNVHLDGKADGNSQEGKKKSDYYELVGLQGSSYEATGIAEVKKSTLKINISIVDGQSNTVKFGVGNPEYKIRIAGSDIANLADEDKTRYSACTTNAEYEAFFRTYLGFTGWEYDRTIYSPENNSYRVAPTFDTSSANYLVDITQASDMISVTRDAGQENVNYVLGQKKPNEYYQGLIIKPYGQYDAIRLITSSDRDVNVSDTRAEVSSWFTNILDSSQFEDMTDGTVSFQLMDRTSGAVSKIVTLTGINNDTTAPELVNVEVSPVYDYINEFKFGAYYHPQIIDGVVVATVKLTFTYEAEDSDCDILHYYYTDKNGATVGDLVRDVKLIKKAGTSNQYQASMIIGSGESGQLIVYATDTTGNESKKSRIKLKDYNEFSSLDEYYEWMVENIINAVPIEVTDMNFNPISKDGVWYSGVKFSVTPEDNESGVNHITWKITKPDGEVATKDVYVPNHDTVQTFKQTFSDELAGSDILPGSYKIGCTFYDNAGNSIDFDDVEPILIDCKDPVIKDYTLIDENATFLSGVVFDFDVIEDVNESGVATVTLYKDNHGTLEELNSWGPSNKGYKYNITENGKYTVVAVDNAGNRSEYDRVFSGISDVAPNAPVITIKDGVKGNGLWYKEIYPNVNIVSAAATSDGTPIITHYSVESTSKEIERTFNTEDIDFALDTDGLITIKAWAVSASNCESPTTSAYVYVDTEIPVIEITGSSTDSNGNVTVEFKVIDKVSGVNLNKVLVNGEAVTVKEKNGVATGSFVASAKQKYTISAEDVAGNIASNVEFVPFSMKVSPVTKITTNSAHIDARLYEGTYPVSDYYIAYKKHSDKTYSKCAVNKTNESYGLRLSFDFNGLDQNTIYDYKVYATTKVSNETKTFEGSFKTSTNGAKASVYGSVKYANSNLINSMKTYPIYVGLYEGNVCIAGYEIKSESSTDYIFKNVADGTYRVVATNGTLTRTKSVTVEKGGIIYPTDYASKGGVNIELSGLNTRVVIDDGIAAVAVDGLEKVFDNFNTAVVTNDDLAVVNNGGTVDIVLHTSYLNVSQVGASIRTAFENNIKNGEIKRYIKLYIVKEVRNENGALVNGTPVQISRLAEPVTVSFPLGDLAGQNINVASMHGEGNNYSFIDWGADDVTLTGAYVTISTNKFSVYALYKTNKEASFHTVKWLDGNGKVLKVEVVEHGKSATPPAGTPTKKATKKYKYKFVGWNKSYNSITADTIISAKFKAIKIKPSKPDEPDKPDDPDKPDKPDEPDKPDDPEPGVYTYLGSGEPKTGDGTPIALLVVAMIGAAGGMIVLRKKVKED